MVGDIEELEEVDASELHAWRVNAKEVLTPMEFQSHLDCRKTFLVINFLQNVLSEIRLKEFIMVSHTQHQERQN